MRSGRPGFGHCGSSARRRCVDGHQTIDHPRETLRRRLLLVLLLLRSDGNSIHPHHFLLFSMAKRTGRFFFDERNDRHRMALVIGRTAGGDGRFAFASFDFDVEANGNVAGSRCRIVPLFGQPLKRRRRRFRVLVRAQIEQRFPVHFHVVLARRPFPAGMVVMMIFLFHIVDGPTGQVDQRNGGGS